MLRGGRSLGLPVSFLAIREVWLLESSGIKGRWTCIRMHRNTEKKEMLLRYILEEVTCNMCRGELL